jgi:transposase
VPRKEECLPVLAGPLKDIGDLEIEMPRIKYKSGKGDQPSGLVNQSEEGDMAVRSVGIDVSLTAEHRAVALDEGGNQCGRLSFRSTPDGLACLSELCFGDGSVPTVVLEPTGLGWLPIVLYLKARCPEVVLVRAKEQKVAALRRLLRGHAKSDRIDALTLARLPWVDLEHLEPLWIVNPDMQRLDRLARRRDRLAKDVGNQKTRIAAYLMGLFPGLWDCFEDPWNPRARWIYRHLLDPLKLSRLYPSQLARRFWRLTPGSTALVIQRESKAVVDAARRLAALYGSAVEAGLASVELFHTWQEEISMELELMEAAEAQIANLEEEIGTLYRVLHPDDHLRTIPGIGPKIAPLLLAAIGDPNRFHNAKAFCQWTGVLPRSHQSSSTNRLGLGMSKAGPARVKRALYQAAEYARRWDPQLAALYFRQMVDYGKTHKQAMGAVMSHLAARVYAVLKQHKPYQVRDFDGQPLTRIEAGDLIRQRLHVPEHVRQLRRHRQTPTKKDGAKVPTIIGTGRWEIATIYGAAEAPQRGFTLPSPQGRLYPTHPLDIT